MQFLSSTGGEEFFTHGMSTHTTADKVGNISYDQVPPSVVSRDAAAPYLAGFHEPGILTESITAATESTGATGGPFLANMHVLFILIAEEGNFFRRNAENLDRLTDAFAVRLPIGRCTRRSRPSVITPEMPRI